MSKINNDSKSIIIAFSIIVGVLVILGGFTAGKAILNRGGNSAQSSVKESSSDGNSASFTKEVESIQDVAKKLSPSVVSIVGRSQTRSYFYGLRQETQNAGTGIIVSKDGYIITNKHVVERTNQISVILNDGEVYDDVKVVAKDPLNDVAYLKISGVDNLTPAELGDSKTIQIGQEVVAIGNALGEYQNTVTSGIISGVNRSLRASSEDGEDSESLSNMIQTDAAINSGNSGGPLVNAKGQVIGINTAVATEAQGIGFAIPISSVKGMLKSLIENGKAERPFFGVNYVNITPSLAKEEKLPVKSGAYISREKGRVISGSSADKAGIRAGDIITKINDTKIDASVDISTLISEYKVGDTIKVTLIRNGEEIEKEVKLQAYRN